MTRSAGAAGKLSNPLLIFLYLFNEFHISVLFMRGFCSDWTSVHLYTVLFFCCCLYQKKLLQLLFIKCSLSVSDSLEMMQTNQKVLLKTCRKEWLLGLHAKRSTVLRMTFWDGAPVQSCCYFLRNRLLNKRFLIICSTNSKTPNKLVLKQNLA